MAFAQAQERVFRHLQEAFDFGLYPRPEGMLNVSIAARRAEGYASYSYDFNRPQYDRIDTEPFLAEAERSMRADFPGGIASRFPRS